MNLVPANDAFVAAVDRACTVLGLDRRPSRAIAMLPGSQGCVLRLIGIAPDDPRHLTIRQEVQVTSNEEPEMRDALRKLYPGEPVADDLVFILERVEKPGTLSGRWVLAHPRIAQAVTVEFTQVA